MQLTVLKCTNQLHPLRSQCCATTTSISFRNTSVIPKGWLVLTDGILEAFSRERAAMRQEVSRAIRKVLLNSRAEMTRSAGMEVVTSGLADGLHGGVGDGEVLALKDRN